MGVKTVRPRLNMGSGDTYRNPSPNIWADCLWHEINAGAIPGVTFWEDFESIPITPATTEGNWSRYAQFSSTGGTITAGTGQGGEAIFASDGDNEGASIRTLATPFKIARTTKKLWYEVRVKCSSVADNNSGWFVGLMENAALTATVPITAAGAIADVNIVGFHRLEGDGDQIDTVYKANGVTAVSVGTDVLSTALAADTYVKLGMVYQPDEDPLATAAGTNNKYLLTYYVNNLRLSAYKQIPSADGTDFPNDVGLGLVIAILNATGTSPGTLTVDWVRCAQLI